MRFALLFKVVVLLYSCVNVCICFRMPIETWKSALFKFSGGEIEVDKASTADIGLVELDEITSFNELNARLDVLVDKWYSHFLVKSSRQTIARATSLLESTIKDCELDMVAVLAQYPGYNFNHKVIALVLVL